MCDVNLACLPGDFLPSKTCATQDAATDFAQGYDEPYSSAEHNPTGAAIAPSTNDAA